LVKSELHQLEKLIGEIVADEQTNNGNLPAKFADRVKSVAEVSARLKGKWIHDLFSAVKEQILTRYVQFHQAGITSLSNQVSVRIPASYFQGAKDPVYHLYYAVVANLEELLEFLRQGFYQYFDRDYAVSFDHLRVQTAHISVLAGEVQLLFQGTAIDPRLTTAVLASIANKLKNARTLGISYRHLSYCSALLQMINQLLMDNPRVTTVDIARELYCQNFNSYQFNRWYQNHLGAIINAAAENQHKTTILSEIEALNQLFVERDKIFEPGLPPINDQLLSWLSGLLPAQPVTQVSNFLKINGHLRMPLQFSVTQFALFVRLCYLEGCFHVNNISDILRFFTQHFETKKQLNISFKSFARAFYGADQATAAVVRDFLQRMINTLNKTYFP